MAINPYTTAAKYTYMPIPFREMMYAGAAADKRTASLLANAEKYNSTLPHWDGDEDAAKKLFDNKEKVKQDLINNFHKDYGNYAEVSRDLMNLASREKRLGGPEYELYKRLQQANKYKEDLKESGWKGTAADYSLSTLTAEPFQNYTEAEGAGDVTGATIPKYMSGEDIQGAMNTMLTKLKDQILKIVPGAKLDEMTGSELIAYGIESGVDEQQLKNDLAFAITDDIINAQQQYSNADIYQQSLSKDNPKEWFNDNQVNERDWYTWKDGVGIVPKLNTKTGKLVEALAGIASGNKLKIVKDKESAATKAKAKQEAKSYKEGQTSMDLNSWSKINKTTPLSVYDELYGTEDKPGILSQIEQTKENMLKAKSEQGERSSDYVAAKANLNILEDKRKNIETILDAYQDKLYATNEDWKELQDFEDNKKDIVLENIANSNIDNPMAPEYAAGGENKKDFFKAIEYLEDSSIYENILNDNFINRFNNSVRNGIIHKAIPEDKFDLLTEDQQTYLKNLTEYHLDVMDNNKDMRDILSEETDDIIKDYDGKINTITTRRIPIKYKASDNQVLNDKSQPKWKWGKALQDGVEGYTIINASGDPAVSSDKKQEDLKKLVRETTGVYSSDGIPEKNDIEFLGVTGATIGGKESPPMLHYRIWQKGKDATKKTKEIYHDIYAIPHDNIAQGVWDALVEDYSNIDTGGEANKRAAEDVVSDIGNYGNLIKVQNQIGYNIFNHDYPPTPTTGESNYIITLGGGKQENKSYTPQGGKLDYTAIDPDKAILSVSKDGIVRVTYDDPTNPGVTQTDSFSGGLIDNGDSWRAAVAHILTLQKFTEGAQTVAASTIATYPNGGEQARTYAMNRAVPIVQNILGPEISTNSREFNQELRVFMEKVNQQMNKKNTSATSGPKKEEISED